MSELKMTKDFLSEALTNGTFEVDATEKTLRKSLDNSFSYLYRLQRNIVEYEEFHFTTRNVVEIPDYGDLYLDKRGRVCININTALILSHEKEAYKRSKYFKTEISLKDLTNERDIFNRIPVIIIDNKVLRDFSVVLQDGSFTAILPFEKNFMQEKAWSANTINLNGTKGDNVYIEHKIDIQIISNTNFFDFKVNTGMIMRNSYDKKSFDRILKSYLKNINPLFNGSFNGSFFAVLFYESKDKLGSFLQDVEVDENGDYIVNWDETCLQKLNWGGIVTIRFIFYRYLRKHKDVNGLDINVRLKNDKKVSEIVLLREEETNKTYEMPVPTENLMMLKEIFNKDGSHNEWHMFDNQEVHMTYPNLYRVENGLDDVNKIRMYYFYNDGYDLKYNHKYWWFYRYLEFKWGRKYNLTLEQVINKIYFEDINLFEEFEINVDNEDIDENMLYEFNIYGMELRDELINNKWHPYIGNSAIITEPEKPIIPHLKNVRWEHTNLNVIGYTRAVVLRFQKLFEWMINMSWFNYVYDEIDYLKNYQHNLTPLEYKIFKLKSFIKDDVRCFHDYLLIQDKTLLHEHFTVDIDKLKNRIRNTSEAHHEKFSEDMYVFTFERKNSRDQVSCRFFINGLLYDMFVHETYGFTDFVYIPISAVSNGDEIDIEVYPSLTQKELIHFNTMSDMIELEIESANDIKPTISDLVFYDKNDIYKEYKQSDFKVYIMSDRYNYKTSDDEITVYTLKEEYSYHESIWYDNVTNDVYKLFSNGVVEKYDYNGNCTAKLDRKDLPEGLINIVHNGTKPNRHKGYYNAKGEHFTSEGQPDDKNNIPAYILARLVVDDVVEPIQLLPTDNECLISLDKEYIGYRDVIAGSSILNPDNKDVNVSKITRIRVQCMNEELLGIDIAVKIDKSSGYIYRTYDDTVYPCIDLNMLNPYARDEYIRVFKDGRLVGKKRYALMTNLKNPRVQMIDTYDNNERLFLDLMPYRNRLIRYIHELDSDEVDLRNYIDKPFDLRYYDVYLNGRRLNEKNIYPLAPWLFKLGGTHSKYNLEIFEKDRDWEYYACDFGDYYTLGDFLDEIFMEEELRDDIIKDIYPGIPPNDNTESEEEYDTDITVEQLYFEMFYYDRLLPLHLANSDIDQFNLDDIRDNFDIIYRLYHHKDDLGNDVLFLNPDDYFDSGENNGMKWFAYMLGELESDENIDIKLGLEDNNEDIYIRQLHSSNKLLEDYNN